MALIQAYVEVGTKKVFASALDWPGWSRSAKDEEGALAALAAYAPRYAVATARASVAFRPGKPPGFEVVARIPGSGGTDFGVPGEPAPDDDRPLPPKEAARLAALVAAAWDVFDDVVAAPAELRKGPRGGGRDRDRIAEHVAGADHPYARKLGVKLKAPDPADRAAVEALRAAVLDAIRSGASAGGWSVRYAARRIAWHALDHAWEIEDRSSPAQP